MSDEPSIVNRLVRAIADSEHDHPGGDDSYIVDLTRKDAVDAAKRIAELHAELLTCRARAKEGK